MGLCVCVCVCVCVCACVRARVCVTADGVLTDINYHNSWHWSLHVLILIHTFTYKYI